MYKRQSEYYISTPAQLAGLAALVNGMADPAAPRVIGNTKYLQSTRVDGIRLVGAGGGSVTDRVYTSSVDFAYKTVYLTADLDMGGVYNAATNRWSGPNWTPIGGKYPMKPSEVAGDCLTLDTRFHGVLDGQGHTISNPVSYTHLDVYKRQELRHALHHAEAVAVVQIRRRLVHDEHPRVLHERARNEHELPLAAADALAAALG